MTKIRILTVSVILLLLLNAGLLFFGFSHGPQPSRHDGPKTIIIEHLHLDQEQVARYDLLIKEHQETIREKELELAQSKAGLYALFTANDRSAADSLLTAITAIQAEIETIHFDHFAEIEALCREDQKADFKALSTELLELFKRDIPLEK